MADKKMLSKDELPPQKRSHPPEKPKDEEDEEGSEESGDEGNQSGTEEGELEDVHSANNWESAQLGDEQRKSKFLRLMGAAKKEHKGRFVIGSPASAAEASKHPHGRTSEEEKQLEEKLESQFEHSLSERLRHRDKKHRGLGFDDDKESPAKTEDKEKSKDDGGRSTD